MNARTVAYVRVSSKAQTHDMQRAAIEAEAARRGDAVGAWYAEKLSGKTVDRPELNRLRADVAARRVARLYVYRIDRLTRSGIRDTLQLVEELRSSEVQLVSCADGFSLDGPVADVVLAVMSWAAQMERLAINERISGARVAMESKGSAGGGRRA